MQRDTGGVVRIKGKDLREVLRRLGEAHATDRPAQVALVRILATGRATKCLADEPDLLEADRYFRWLGLYRGANEQAAGLRSLERDLVDAYCEGLNSAMAARPRPMSFRAWGYSWEPWQPKDVVTLVRLMSWMGLVSAQVAAKQTIVEMVQAGVAKEKLVELFAPGLDGCDFELLKQVTLVHRVTPAVLAAAAKIGTVAASNNWAVAPHKSRSGHALLANDMHLEVNRLPSVWYEAILQFGDDYIIGTTVPGLPGVITGRNRQLAWGVTYSHADTVDLFVEDCRDGRYKKDGVWHCFEKTTERIERKKHPPETVEVYRNAHGLLLGDAAIAGKYLSLGWAAWHADAADCLEALFSLLRAETTEQGMKAVERAHYPSLNWVFADRAGNIGYRMGGLVPRRPEGDSRLYPVAGDDSSNDWRDFVPADQLPSAFNPPEGFVATANQDLAEFGKARVQSCPLNAHRHSRICERLVEKELLDLDDMKSIQLDVFSRKATALVPMFARVMPECDARRWLVEWNHEFDCRSSSATLFEDLYMRALVAVFCRGPGSIPEAMFRHVRRESSVGLSLDLFFERTLRREQSLWFNGTARDEVLREAFVGVAGESWPPWGQVNRITMVNLFFGGKLPRWLGMDRGPFSIPGSADTPRQGTVYREAGRDTSFCPSNRFVSDLGTDEVHTILPGGPSEKRFSGLYATDVEGWLEGKYKRLVGGTG